MKVHPTSIISGYKLAAREAVKYVTNVLATKIKDGDNEILINTARTSMSSKLIGP